MWGQIYGIVLSTVEKPLNEAICGTMLTGNSVLVLELVTVAFPANDDDWYLLNLNSIKATKNASWP